MSQRDSGWIQLYAETNQEAADLHVQAFRLAEQLSLPVMVCMDGFILTHAFERVELPTQEQVDAFLPPFVPRQVLDPDEPVTIGAMVGPEAFTEVRYLMHAKQMQALDAIPEIAADFAAAFGRESGGLLRGLPQRGRRDRRRRARLGARHDRGRHRRAARRGRVDRRVGDQVLPAVAARRGPRGARRTPSAWSWSRRRSPSAPAGSSARTCGSRCRGSPPQVYDVVAGLGGRPITKASLRGLLERGAARTSSSASPSSTSTRSSSQRELARMGADRRSGPHAENMLRDIGAVARGAGLMPYQPIKFYQAGSFVVGNRLLDPEQRSVQSDTERSNTLTSGHRACQGCGEALGARYALDAAMRATEGKLIAANATGCLEVFSTPFPETSWQLPWIHSLFGNAPAVATGIAAALKAKGRDDIRVDRPGRRRRHGRHRLRLPVGHVRAQRRRALRLLRQRGLHEHRRAALRRDAARRPHDHHAGRRPEPGNVFGQGKSAPLIAMAHEIPYVATATVADLRDLEDKVEHAMELRGARYIHVLVTCPLGWGCDVERDVQVARLAKETGLFPVFEAEAGEVTASRRSAARCRSRSTCETAAALRAPVQARAPRRRDRRAAGARRPQHPPLRPRWRRH